MIINLHNMSIIFHDVMRPKISQRCSALIPAKSMAWWNGKGWRGENDWEKGNGKNGKHGQKGPKGQKGQKGKGKDGKDGKDGERKGKGFKGWRKEEWYPQEEARSQLSSEAADFIPSGLYDYDVLSHQYWDMAEEATWREFADHEGTKYYYNCKTGLTQWERPAELDLPKPESPKHQSPEKGKAGSGKAKGYGGYHGGDAQGAPAWAKGEKGKKGEKGEGKARKGKDGKDGKGKKEKSKEKDDATFGPQGCNLFVFHLPDEWGDEDMLEQLGCKPLTYNRAPGEDQWTCSWQCVGCKYCYWVIIHHTTISAMLYPKTSLKSSI